MSDPTTPNDSLETPGNAAAEAHPHVHGPECDHEHEHEDEHEDEKLKPITIELDDLTAEAKAKAEEQLHRPIPDRPYAVASQENRPGSVVALTLEVPAEAFEGEQKALLEDLRKEIVLPGYRKGKAPVNLILKRLGEDAVRDTIASLATNVLRQEQAKQNWLLLTKPSVKTFCVPGKDGGPARIELEMETAPKVELKEYKGLTVEVERREVTDAMVEARLEELRRQNAVQEKAGDDHELTADDLIVADIEVVNEAGERLEHLCQTDRTIFNWQRELPKEAVEPLLGKRTGETVQATVSNKTTNRRGEEIIHQDAYRVTIKEIRATRLPALDDEFAKDLGEHADLAALRTKVRDELRKAEEERRRSEGLGRLYRLIIEKNPIDVPHSLVAHEQYQMIMQDSYQMQRYGLRLDQVVQDIDRYMRDQRTSADENVRLQLLMVELRKAENLESGEADVDAEIERMAQESGRKPLAVRARLEAQNQLDDLRKRLAGRKVGDFLMSQNTVTLVEPKPVEAPAETTPEAAGTEPEAKTKSEAKPKAARKAKSEKTESTDKSE